MVVSFSSQQADEREQKARDYMRAEVGYTGKCVRAILSCKTVVKMYGFTCTILMWLSPPLSLIN